METQEQNLITFTPTPTSSNQDRSPRGDNIVEAGLLTATGDEGSQPQQTPQPQCTPRTRESQDITDQSQSEVSNIPQESTDEPPGEMQQATPPRTVDDINTDEQAPIPYDSSYLRLPIPQGGAKEKICWRCGEPGHSKRICNRQVSCTFCQAYSHATKACKKYASFVKNSQGTSSRKTNPVQNYSQGNQQWNNQAQPQYRK